MKFNENLSTGSPAVPRGRTDGRTGSQTKHEESNNLLFAIFRKLLKINVKGRRFPVNGHFGVMPCQSDRYINVCVYVMALSRHEVSALTWNIFPRLETRSDVNAQGLLSSC